MILPNLLTRRTMSETVKNKGFGFNLGNTFKYTVKQLKKIGNIRHILSRKHREEMLVASKTYLQPIYDFMKKKTEKWTLPSLYSFVILLLVTVIRIQYFPGIEMYKSILFVMLHRFLVNGVENFKNFQLVQNFINNSKVLSFLFGRSKQQQASTTSSDPFLKEQLGDMKKEVSTSLATSFSTFINDFFQNTDISIVTKKLTKFVMSILILLLVFYFIEYYFPEPLKYQRVITPYISRLPSMVQEVLTRLITFLKNKIPIFIIIRIVIMSTRKI